VFPLNSVHSGKPLTAPYVGYVVSQIGQKAGVVVDTALGKCATAHDLRRAFGTRWAVKVRPAVLQRLMRHSSIQTSMGYYVELDADELADQLWADHGARSGNSFGNIEAERASFSRES
jgi:integrase